MTVEERLLKVIKNSGLSQKDFAKSIGVSNSNISNWINPDYKSKPSFDALIRISEKHYINMNWLLSEEGEMYIQDLPDNKIEVVSNSTKSEIEQELLACQKELIQLRQQNTSLKEENKELNIEIKDKLKKIIKLQDKLLNI